MEETIGTKEATFRLGISPQRVRQLLKNNRIKGAQKIDGTWVIPVENGIPKIQECKKGPKGTWNQRLGREKALTINPKYYAHLVAFYQPKIIKTQEENDRIISLINELENTDNRTLEEDVILELLITLIKKFEEEGCG